ncbi:MAG: metal-dependent hydrolase [Myxococcota bacterium]
MPVPTPSSPSPSTVRSPIPVRRQRHDWNAVPSNWLGGDLLASAIADGANLLFPEGERFFVRSVRAFEHAIEDGVLRQQLRGFYGQEGNHAREHERYFEMLRQRGVRFDGFLKVFGRNLRWLEEKVSPELNLAATAASEHFTALMAENGVVHGTLDEAHPIMRDFLLWHAVEEIEHKAVAFDVLKRVDPRYRTRILGLLIASIMLSTHWAAATLMIARQEGMSFRDIGRALGRLRQAHKRGEGPKKRIVRDVFVAGIRSYLRKDFHPDQLGDVEALERYMKTRPDLQVQS